MIPYEFDVERVVYGQVMSTPATTRTTSGGHHRQTTSSVHGVDAKTIHIGGNKVFSTSEKNGCSNLDFPQLIVLNVPLRLCIRSSPAARDRSPPGLPILNTP
jgi:hypothetical protein